MKFNSKLNQIKTEGSLNNFLVTAGARSIPPIVQDSSSIKVQPDQNQEWQKEVNVYRKVTL